MSAVNTNTTVDWTPAHETVRVLIRNKVPTPKLDDAVKNVKDLNLFHTWRDASFNLLFHAVTENNLEAFKVLIANGANVRLANDNMTTIMQLLAKRGLTEWADEAVMGMDKEQKSSFLNRSNFHGWTPLMSAAENQHLAFCQWLLENGANVNDFMDATGWTAMHAASKMGCLPIVKLLKENGGDHNMKAQKRELGTDLTVKAVTKDASIVSYLEQFC